MLLQLKFHSIRPLTQCSGLLDPPEQTLLSPSSISWTDASLPVIWWIASEHLLWLLMQSIIEYKCLIPVVMIINSLRSKVPDGSVILHQGFSTWMLYLCSNYNLFSSCGRKFGSSATFTVFQMEHTMRQYFQVKASVPSREIL